MESQSLTAPGLLPHQGMHPQKHSALGFLICLHQQTWGSCHLCANPLYFVDDSHIISFVLPSFSEGSRRSQPTEF